MTEIFRFLFFTEISSYFLEESDRNFGEVLIKGGVLIFNSPVYILLRGYDSSLVLSRSGGAWVRPEPVIVIERYYYVYPISTAQIYQRWKNRTESFFEKNMIFLYRDWRFDSWVILRIVRAHCWNIHSSLHCDGNWDWVFYWLTCFWTSFELGVWNEIKVDYIQPIRSKIAPPPAGGGNFLRLLTTQLFRNALV